MSTRPERPSAPATVLTICAGDRDPSALIAHITALRQGLDGRVIVPASATRCDSDLLSWPTGARHHVRVAEVAGGADTVGRRVAAR